MKRDFYTLDVPPQKISVDVVLNDPKQLQVGDAMLARNMTFHIPSDYRTYRIVLDNKSQSTGLRTLTIEKRLCVDFPTNGQVPIKSVETVWLRTL